MNGAMGCWYPFDFDLTCFYVQDVDLSSLGSLATHNRGIFFNIQAIFPDVSQHLEFKGLKLNSEISSACSCNSGLIVLINVSTLSIFGKTNSPLVLML